MLFHINVFAKRSSILVAFWDHGYPEATQSQNFESSLNWIFIGVYKLVEICGSITQQMI